MGGGGWFSKLFKAASRCRDYVSLLLNERNRTIRCKVGADAALRYNLSGLLHPLS